MPPSLPHQLFCFLHQTDFVIRMIAGCPKQESNERFTQLPPLSQARLRIQHSAYICLSSRLHISTSTPLNYIQIEAHGLVRNSLRVTELSHHKDSTDSQSLTGNIITPHQSFNLPDSYFSSYMQTHPYTAHTVSNLHMGIIHNFGFFIMKWPPSRNQLAFHQPQPISHSHE